MKEQKGFSIVELMVGLFVGLLVLLSAYNSVEVLQNSKATMMSSNSALANAISGMHLLGSEIRSAGLGLSANNQIACTNLNAWYSGAVVSNGERIAPVIIVDGGNGPDEIQVFYGDSVLSAAPAQLLVTMASSTDTLTINQAIGNQVAGLALLASPVDGAPCTLVEITNVNTAGDNAVLSHESGDSLYNPADPDTTYTTSAAYTTDSLVLSIGDLHWLNWGVNNNHLEVTNLLTGATDELAENIVDIQAQYGVTNGFSNEISQWVNATDDWANLDSANINRIKAVRIAMVVRSAKRENTLDEQGNCSTTTQQPVSWPGGPILHIDQLNDWQCYRYRTVRTIFPLKNMLWGVNNI